MIHHATSQYVKRIMDIDAECDEEIVAIQTTANELIGKVEAEAGRKIAEIREHMEHKIHAIQSEANIGIRKSLSAGIVRISKEIKKMGKKYQHDALRKCDELTTEDFAAIIAESVKAVRAKREKAGSEAIEKLGISAKMDDEAESEATKNPTTKPKTFYDEEFLNSMN